MHKEYNQSPRQVLEDLHAAETGLSGREAETRLGQYAPRPPCFSGSSSS